WMMLAVASATVSERGRRIPVGTVTSITCMAISFLFASTCRANPNATVRHSTKLGRQLRDLDSELPSLAALLVGLGSALQRAGDAAQMTIAGDLDVLRGPRMTVAALLVILAHVGIPGSRTLFTGTTLVRQLTRASTALTTPPAGLELHPLGVLLVVRMPLRAVRRSTQSSSRSVGPSDVRPGRDGLQVRRIAAAAMLAGLAACTPQVVVVARVVDLVAL